MYRVKNIKIHKSKLFGGTERTSLIKKNIAASFLLRLISIASSLIVVPMTIHYVNAEQYGIWLTLSSIIVWLSYFDFGFAHGFRNRFAEAVAKDDMVLARRYVSTTYAVLALLFMGIMLVASVINQYIDWSSILNVSAVLNEELQMVFQILIVIFCVNIVAEVFSTMMTAYQRPAVAAGIKTAGNVLALGSISILTLTTEGSLKLLALAFMGVPCILTIIVSAIVFAKNEYRRFAPSIRCVDLSLTRSIVGMGGKFFAIMMCMLLIFQCTNLIISRELGPESVTLYNVTYKLFGIAEMVVMIILTPIWSAYTDAYTRKDFVWMKNCSRKLERMGLLCLPLLIVMVMVSPFIFDAWLGDSVSTSLGVSAALAFFIFCKIMGAIYMHQVNGTGKVLLQLCMYIVMALVTIPLMILCSRMWGLTGIVVMPSLAFALQALISRIQLQRIVLKKDTGWWGK